MTAPSHADLLELLHDADRSFRTLRATIRTWRDEERYQEAFWREADEQRATAGPGFAVVVLRKSGEPREPELAEGLVRLWLEPPARMREEIEGRSPHSEVRDGSRIFHWGPQIGAIASEADDDAEPALGEHAVLLRPSDLLGRVDLELLGPAGAAGRAALRVRARPRASTDPLRDGAPGLAPGADEYELLVDAERGLLLRVEARFAGAAFETLEVVELALDEPLDPALFAFEPPGGEPVRSPDEAFGHIEWSLRIEEAVELAPFTVFLPASVPDGWQLMLSFHGAGAAGGDAVLDADYFDVLSGDHVSLVERSGPPRGWTASDDDAVLVVEREGTSVELRSSSFDRERLAELAASLVPLDGRPPPLPG